MFLIGKPPQPSKPAPVKTPAPTPQTQSAKPAVKQNGAFRPMERRAFYREAKKTSLRDAYGRVLQPHKVEEVLKKNLPYGRFGGEIKPEEAKRALRELRHAEYKAKSYNEKLTLRRQREHLETVTKLRGKY